MRILLAALLLSAGAMPALAAPGERERSRSLDERGPAMIERVRAAEARGDEREEERRRRSVTSGEVQPDIGRRLEPAPVFPGADRRSPLVDPPFQRPGSGPLTRRAPDPVRRIDSDSVADWREQDRNRERARRPMLERRERIVRGDPATERLAATEARRPALDLSRPEAAHRWRDEWRRDGRHDWRSHRHRNRWLFRLGFYHDPFGWGYRRLGYGQWLYPSYFARSYWLSDPYRYRLPYVYGPYRWVRYWNDALLVDMRSGVVVDVTHDVFW